MTISVVRAMTAALPAPRNVLVRFRLGQLFGEPGNAPQQRSVLRDTLRALVTAQRSGEVVELPYRWRQEVYRDEPLGSDS